APNRRKVRRMADQSESGGRETDAVPQGAAFRIVDLVLDEHTVVRRSPDVEHERKVAIFDLLEENVFAPSGSDGGPYVLHLAIEDNRLVFDIRLAPAEPEGATEPHGKVLLSLTPFRRIVKDYFMIC